MSPSGASPPRQLTAAVALVAAAMLLVEILVTRLFSVVFFYHFSFFAVSLIMTGLALGGLAVSRWDTRSCALPVFLDRLTWLAFGFAAMTVFSAWWTVDLAERAKELDIAGVALQALIFLPGLVLAGAFLAAAFSRREEWIGKLYAADLVAAALACLAAIAVMRRMQGPAMLLVPAALAALAATMVAHHRLLRGLSLAACLVALTGAGAHLAGDGSFLNLGGQRPIFERWNEHSRIQAWPMAGQRLIIIDRSAATLMRRVTPAQARGEEPVYPRWQGDAKYLAYLLGRPVGRVAIIGVGGGEDLRPPLELGVPNIDGYELNRILIDLLESDFRDFNDLASRPEIELIHAEARVGIANSARTYDLVQASFIDTWAATASGGFVLSENGLYTLEGWLGFLEALSADGMLTMTRWLVADAPSETQRLVALAAEALARSGVERPEENILLAAQALPEAAWFAAEGDLSYATIVASKTPFTAAEVERFLSLCAEAGYRPLAAPGIETAEPVIARLLDNTERARAVAESPFDISPPTDMRPYFFLQIRPRDVLDLRTQKFGPVREITSNGIRVMMVLAVLAGIFTVVVLFLATSTLPSATASPQERRAYRWMSLYFLGIGMGYILVQLGLHQRLILVLGHPTLVLSVVLFWMLLGTGVGAALSERLFPEGTYRRAWWVMLGAVGILALTFDALALLERVGSSSARVLLAGALLTVTGLVLGFGFPIGVRIVSRTGEWAVQKMWAVNGAASIAATALSAFIGVSFGSRAVVIGGLLAYGLMLLAGSRALAAPADPSHGATAASRAPL